MGKELTVQEWFLELDRGLEYRRKYGLEDKWAELEARFYNVHETSTIAGPNIIAATGDSLLSALFVPNPYITTKAERSDSVSKARVVESLNNSAFHTLKVKYEVENMGLSTYLWGTGFGKLGYDSEFGWSPKYDIGGEGRTGFSLTQFDKNQNRIEFAPTKPGMPWFKSILPHDIIVPWGVRSIDEAEWIAHRVIRHVDDIKADVKYSSKRELQPVMSMEDFTKSYLTVQKPYRSGMDLWSSDRRGSRAAEWCELFEIHDRRTGKIFVIATGHKSFLRNETNYLQLEHGLPFVSMSFVPKSRTIWTTSDAYYLLACQAELTDIAYQSTKQRRLSNLKFITEDGSFDEPELDKLTKLNPGGAIKTRKGVKPTEAVTWIQPGTNQQLYMEAENTRRNARETVGLSRNQMGEFEATGRRTAREVMEVSANSNQRSGRRAGIVADVYVSIAEKMDDIFFEHWKTPKVVEVLGQSGESTWLQVTGEDLRGDYKYRVGFSSEPIETLQSRRQSALQTYLMMIQDPAVDQVALRKYLIDAFNDPEFSSIFNSELINVQTGLVGGGGGGSGNSGAAGAQTPGVSGQGLSLAG